MDSRNIEAEYDVLLMERQHWMQMIQSMQNKMKSLNLQVNNMAWLFIFVMANFSRFTLKIEQLKMSLKKIKITIRLV